MKPMIEDQICKDVASQEVYMDVAFEYGRYLGGRFKDKDGEFTGDEFRDDYLIPKLQNLHDNQILVLDFKGCVPSIGTSFLDEAFIKILDNGNWH